MPLESKIQGLMSHSDSSAVVKRLAILVPAIALLACRPMEEPEPEKVLAKPAVKTHLRVYSAVPGLQPSDRYRLRVRPHGSQAAWQPAFAFITTCKDRKESKDNYFPQLKDWSNTYINFEMDGPVEVEISRVSARSIAKAVAHPGHRVNSCEVRDGKAYVVMKEPGLIAVDIDGQMDDQNTGKGYKGPPIHTVTIFGNPVIEDRPGTDDESVYTVKPGEQPPTEGDWETLYFLPGVHDIGVGYQLQTGKNYYLPGDAIVYGTMNNLDPGGPGRDIRIFGHGTLSGARTAHPRFASPRPKQDQMHTPIRIRSAANTSVEGITIADSAYHSLMLLHRHRPDEPTDIRWVKIFTWRGNGDGINPFGNGLIEDCFIRTQDDCAYVGGRGIRRVTFWNDWNGSTFVLSALPNREVIVEDCDVIYARAGWHNWTGGRLFNMRAQGGGDCGKGVVFRNIRVSDPRPTLQHFMIAMQSLNPYFKGVGEQRRKSGHLSGVLFQNIDIAAPSVLGQPDILWGAERAEIRNVTFDNVTIGGKKITDASHFKRNEYVKELGFK